MAANVKEFFEKFGKDSAKMKEQLPEAIGGFAGLFGAVMKEGAVSAKNKELIAVAIAVAVNCTPCIRLHTQKCIKAGASRDEVLEAASVALMMAGGPAFTHLPEVLDTLEAIGE